MARRIGRLVWGVVGLLAWCGSAGGAEPAESAGPRAWREQMGAVRPGPDSNLVCEAEEFRVESPGWQARPWGENYYAATIANTFLSRKAFLGAPEQGQESAASLDVEVAEAGDYLVLARYEAAYRFETQFRIRVEQAGRKVLDRLYGARANVKVWPFGLRLTNEAAFDWGAVENIVWEGHDARAALQPGRATITLTAGAQPEPAARRNVDLVLLTRDQAQVNARIEKEAYLPLDGLLTQGGDLFLRVINRGSADIVLTVPNSREHSPYWVHQRSWKPLSLAAAPGQTSAWMEVGSLLDTLNDGQWPLKAVSKEKGQALRYTVELAAPGPRGERLPAGRFESESDSLALAVPADLRFGARVRAEESVLFDLLEWLKAQPVRGRLPDRTLVFGYTFDPKPADARYTAARADFMGLFRLRPAEGDAGERSAYVDLRGRLATPQDLEAACQDLQKSGRAAGIQVVSLGDEIGLPQPPREDHEGFRAWLKVRGLTPEQADPAAAGDWAKVRYAPGTEARAQNPRLYVSSRRYATDFGIAAMKRHTEIIRRYLPQAGVGANFSPHAGGAPRAYLGEVGKWVTLFRRGGMTMPWSEDYIWQLPVGTPQMNALSLDLFRAGLKGQPRGMIHYYVMPHWPGNTPAMWRRQFYGDLAHGMKVINLFEFRPVQAAYTENHVSLPAMYQAVRTGLMELGPFEDIVQDGQVRRGLAGLWFSEASDIWDDMAGSGGAAKRALYIAIRHQQVPLDVVVDEDALDGTLAPYRALYLADAHVPAEASRAIADWVAAGGTLFATAGAGWFDEFHQTNGVLRSLMGIAPAGLEAPPDAAVGFIKQDLPFRAPLDTVRWQDGETVHTMPVMAVKARFAARDAEVLGTFADGGPALAMHRHGKGRVIVCGFLPSLSYFQPAIPKRPVDRGSTDDAMAHFLPTTFQAGAAALIGLPARDLARPVVCSEPLVETTIIESARGMLIPLVNWSGRPVRPLTVTVAIPAPAGKAETASGAPVKVTRTGGAATFTLDLDVADALILR